MDIDKDASTPTSLVIVNVAIDEVVSATLTRAVVEAEPSTITIGGEMIARDSAIDCGDLRAASVHKSRA